MTRPEEYVATKTTFTKLHALNQKTIAARDWRSALKRKGMTQEQFAKAAGVSEGVVSNVVRNPETVLRTSTLDKLLRALES